MQPVNLKTFWIVIADRPELRATYRHDTFALAKLEAERLSRLNTGTQFFVFQLIGSAVVSEPVVWKAADNLPF